MTNVQGKRVDDVPEELLNSLTSLNPGLKLFVVVIAVVIVTVVFSVVFVT